MTQLGPSFQKAHLCEMCVQVHQKEHSVDRTWTGPALRRAAPHLWEGLPEQHQLSLVSAAPSWTDATRQPQCEEAFHNGRSHYKCSKLGQVFGYKYKLVWHPRIHNGEKFSAYNYSECGESFSFGSILSNHQRVPWSKAL
ncbi:hypothetical protein GH733_011893 [Mirounga leonina]|nr:hypothetical protein GH733_011893 [Mirounga leonina]